MKYYKKLASILLPIFSLTLLTGCTSSKDETQTENNKSEEEIKNQDSSTDNNIKAEDNNTQLEPQDNNTPELKISSKCIGCGKCVRTDPEHFDLSNTTGKSVAISQDNLDSKNLEEAINNCPVNAITL